MLLDFKPLTDDQLVELVRGGFAEAIYRGAAVEAAMRSAMLTEAEKASIATEAIRREAEKIRQAEAEKIAKEATAQLRREAQEREEKATLAQSTLGCIDDMLRSAGIRLNGVKCWCKTVSRIDKTQTNGYSLVGNFVNESQTLNLLHTLYCYCAEGRKSKQYYLFAIRPEGTIDLITEVGDRRDWAVKLWPAVEAYHAFRVAKSEAKKAPEDADLQKKFTETRAVYEGFKTAFAEKLAAERAEAEAAAAKAEAEAKAKAEAEAAAREEVQQRLRALIGGVPVWAKSSLPLMPTDLPEDLTVPECRDNGLRPLVAVRTPENGLRFVAINCSYQDYSRNNSITLDRIVAESVDLLPQELEPLLDATDRAELADYANLCEIGRDALVSISTVKKTSLWVSDHSRFEILKRGQDDICVQKRKYDPYIVGALLPEALAKKMGLLRPVVPASA